MQIPLNEFELHVKPDPLERGLSLFENGRVESIRNVAKSRVEAVVHDGGTLFHPQLMIVDEVVKESSCECGDALDSICRHGSALIFALQSGEFPEGITTRSGKPRKENVGTSSRSKANPVDGSSSVRQKKAPAPKKPKLPKTPADIVAIVPHDELRAFVLQQCQKDKDFAIRLKAHFADLMPATNVAEIKKRIKEMVKAAITVKGKTKKLDQAQGLARGTEWLKEAERFADSQEFLLSFAVCDFLYLELLEIFRQHNLASDNLIDLATQAKQAIQKLADYPLPESDRSAFIAHAIEAWDRYPAMSPSVLLASKICHAGPEFTAINSMFEAALQGYNENYIALHHAMVQRVLGPEAAAVFRKKNADTRHFVSQEVEAALANGDYRSALAAATRGQAKHITYYSDRVYWLELQDSIYERLGDVEGRIALILTAYHSELDSTKLALANITTLAGKDRWEAERAKLADLIAVKQYPDTRKLTDLFSIGQDWEGMINYLKRYKLSRIALLGRPLVKLAPEAFEHLLKAQLEETFDAKTKVTEWEIREIAFALAACIGKDPTITYFRNLRDRFSTNHVLAHFVMHISRELSYYSLSTW